MSCSSGEEVATVRKLVVLGVMLAMVLAVAMPAWADTVSAGGQIAGELEGGAVVAGSPNLAIGAPTLGPGEDAAGAGNFNSAFAIGLNDPFEFNFGVAVGGSFEHSSYAESAFLDYNLALANSGGLEVDADAAFFD